MPGDIPSFQYLDYNTGETIDLFNHHTNQWANNELYLLGSLKNTKLLPEDFTLSAYPNPFNPSTNLQFSVPYNGIITLAIFNIYGQTIAELANEYIAPGIYEITLKITGLAGQEDEETISVVALAQGSDQHELGDVNGDGSVTMVDALLCANHILGLFIFQPVEFLAADIDGNGLINIFDVLSISDLVDQ